MKIFKTIILLILIVALFAGSFYFYNNLSKKYENHEETTVSTTSNVENTKAERTTEDESLAPTFTFYDKNGKKILLSDYIGKPIVINFWASWCGPCKMEMPHYQKAYEKYGKDVQFLMINLTGEGTDSKQRSDKVLKDGGYTFPVFYDNDSMGAFLYSVSSIPVSCFIDKNGKLVKQTIGALTESKLDSYINMIK